MVCSSTIGVVSVVILYMVYMVYNCVDYCMCIYIPVAVNDHRGEQSTTRFTRLELVVPLINRRCIEYIGVVSVYIQYRRC
jgi:hypothetical protein